ncbi:MAG: outer membrane beta-barrel protein [Candidatus Cryptobacteroides sp.]
MKHKLTTLVFVFLLAFGLSSSAQEGLGLHVGYVTSVNISHAFGEKLHSPVMNGLRVGATQDLRLFGKLFFEPGLYYTYLTDKGNIESENNAGYYIADLVKEHFLSIPLMFKYTFELSDALTGLYLFGGPTLVVGLSSKSDIGLFKETTSSFDLLGEVEYDYYKEKFSEGGLTDAFGKVLLAAYLPPAAYRRFDVSLGVGIGLEVLDYLDVKLGYDWGLVNRVTGDISSEYRTRRSQFYVTAGVRF